MQHKFEQVSGEKSMLKENQAEHLQKEIENQIEDILSHFADNINAIKSHIFDNHKLAGKLKEKISENYIVSNAINTLKQLYQHPEKSAYLTHFQIETNPKKKEIYKIIQTMTKELCDKKFSATYKISVLNAKKESQKTMLKDQAKQIKLLKEELEKTTQAKIQQEQSIQQLQLERESLQKKIDQQTAQSKNQTQSLTQATHVIAQKIEEVNQLRQKNNQLQEQKIKDDLAIQQKAKQTLIETKTFLETTQTNILKQTSELKILKESVTKLNDALKYKENLEKEAAKQKVSNPGNSTTKVNSQEKEEAHLPSPPKTPELPTVSNAPVTHSLPLTQAPKNYKELVTQLIKHALNFYELPQFMSIIHDSRHEELKTLCKDIQLFKKGGIIPSDLLKTKTASLLYFYENKVENSNCAHPREKTTLLMLACLLGDVSSINFLLSLGADYNLKDAGGYNCFMYAILGGHPLAVGRLLSVNGFKDTISQDYPVRIQQAPNGTTQPSHSNILASPLVIAIGFHFEIAKMLLKHGGIFSPHQQPAVENYLQHSSIHADLELFDLICVAIKKSPLNISIKTYVCFASNIDVLRIFIQHGAYFNAKTAPPFLKEEVGITSALQFAVALKDLPLCQIVNIQDNMSPDEIIHTFKLAIIKNEPSILNYVVDLFPDYIPRLLVSIDKKENKHVCQTIYDRWLITEPSLKKMRSFFQEISKNDLDALNELFSIIDASKKCGPEGWDLLYCAVESDRMDLVQLLLKNGANYNSTYANQVSILHYAMTLNKLPITKYLLEKGADIKYRSNYGNALSLALQLDNSEFLRIICSELNKKAIPFIFEIMTEVFILAIKCGESTSINKVCSLLNMTVREKTLNLGLAFLAICANEVSALQTMIMFNPILLKQQHITGFNMLDIALLCNSTDVITFLRTQHQKPNIVWEPQPDIELFCGHDKRNIPEHQLTFMQACFEGDAVKVVELLTSNQKIDIHYTLSSGVSALMLAALKGRTDIISYLLNFNAQNLLPFQELIRSAISFARISNSQDIITLLETALSPQPKPSIIHENSKQEKMNDAIVADAIPHKEPTNTSQEENRGILKSSFEIPLSDVAVPTDFFIKQSAKGKRKDDKEPLEFTNRDNEAEHKKPKL